MTKEKTKPTKVRKKPGRKPKKKLYFGPEVQDAIIRYNALDSNKNQSERNQIYGKEIHAAFDKLAENIINTFKFSYFDDPFEDVKHEVVAFMVTNIHKYDHTKGSKAFSYFSIVAKNYLILHNNQNYKKLKSHTDVKALNNKPQHVQADLTDLVEELIIYFEKNINTMFKKKRDISIAFAILELLQKREEIENFNKKSIYLLVREMTGVKTTQITRVVNELKKKYILLAKQYHRNGTIIIGDNIKFFK
tara:strand:+ start:268 stop:1011 length:744 start_codon:yes stop_codon:yes gene_type:complete